jgi:hypothetical protein
MWTLVISILIFSNFPVVACTPIGGLVRDYLLMNTKPNIIDVTFTERSYRTLLFLGAWWQRTAIEIIISNCKSWWSGQTGN